MHFTDILSLCVSILGLYGLVYYLRFLIPRNVLPRVSAVLSEVEHLLCLCWVDQRHFTIEWPSVNSCNVRRCHASMNEPSPYWSTYTVVLMSSCGCGRKFIVPLEYCSNSSLLFDVVWHTGCIRFRHESSPSRLKLRFVETPFFSNLTIDGRAF